MQIAILIARIVLMVLEGVAASTAVEVVSRMSGMSFMKLWNRLPSRYK